MSKIPDGVGVSVAHDITNMLELVSDLRSFGQLTRTSGYYLGPSSKMCAVAIIKDDLVQAHATYARAPQYQKAQLAAAARFGAEYVIIGQEQNTSILAFCRDIIGMAQADKAGHGRLIEIFAAGPPSTGPKEPSAIHSAWIEEFGAAPTAAEIKVQEGQLGVRLWRSP